MKRINDLYLCCCWNTCSVPRDYSKGDTFILFPSSFHEGFLLFNQRIAVGSTTLHVKCCPGAEDSLANSFPSIWKAIVDVGVGGGHHDHGTQNKLLPFLLTSGIKKCKNWKSNREPFLDHNPTIALEERQ